MKPTKPLFLLSCFLMLLTYARGQSEPPPAGSLSLALDYVVLETNPEIGKTLSLQADQQIRYANAVWNPCGIGFLLERLKVVNPNAFHLPGAPSNYFDLDAIRTAFSSAKALLVVITQKWNRGGSLGQSKASAWTSMPHLAPYGSIIESPESGQFGLVAHELGHYLNLGHTPDRLNLMNSVIYDSSRLLEESQCERARLSARTIWRRMLR